MLLLLALLLLPLSLPVLLPPIDPAAAPTLPLPAHSTTRVDDATQRTTGE